MVSSLDKDIVITTWKASWRVGSENEQADRLTKEEKDQEGREGSGQGEASGELWASAWPLPWASHVSYGRRSHP